VREELARLLSPAELAAARRTVINAHYTNAGLVKVIWDAARPYDLRHGGVTLALNTIPASEVARRAGHGVEVLLRVYAGCIEGHKQLWNQCLDEALAEDEPSE
jgi:hypothetical protein